MRPGDSIDGWLVLSCSVGFRVDLSIASSRDKDRSEARLSFSGQFGLATGEENLALDVEGPKRELGPLLELVGLRVSESNAAPKGKLTVTFDDGWCLTIDPDPEFEAWELRTPKEHLVCRPGGGLSTWASER